MLLHISPGTLQNVDRLKDYIKSTALGPYSKLYQSTPITSLHALLEFLYMNILLEYLNLYSAFQVWQPQVVLKWVKGRNINANLISGYT